MQRENIIDKIRKLRSLAQDKSTTVEEAATAALLAERLIQKHSLAETELAGIGSESILDDGIPLTDWGKRQTVWQNVLCFGLAKAYNCESVYKNKDGHPNIYAVGRASDVALLRYQYSFFVLELTRLSHLLAPKDLQRGSGKTWYNSFYRGAVHAILASMKKAKIEVRSQADSSALVIIDQHVNRLASFIAKQYPDSKVVKKALGHIDPNAYQAGKEAGANLNPKPGLSSGVRGLLT